MAQTPVYPLAYAAAFCRSVAAFRMWLRGWTPERLRDEADRAQAVLPTEYAVAYAEEREYRREHPHSRGA